MAERRLVRVLEEWTPSIPGFFLYYPSRRLQPAALSALVNALRQAFSCIIPVVGFSQRRCQHWSMRCDSRNNSPCATR
ncbi:hypothetical protein [Mesorhizobium sp. LNHC209A00]|uniref:hypothetical protein n=1 Tax=Mesorhizobium sp. LNHC209A00 TaxID=1287226 RepID=UPI001FD89A9E|nr:hypothetical protein [Mesorhizobium sp. LNHC209A00]